MYFIVILIKIVNIYFQKKYTTALIKYIKELNSEK